MQAHEVDNLFVVDGGPFVSQADKNPTWTILALSWRTSEYIIDQLKEAKYLSICDRRESLKSLLVGSVAGGLVLKGCSPGEQPQQEQAANSRNGALWKDTGRKTQR